MPDLDLIKQGERGLGSDAGGSPGAVARGAMPGLGARPLDDRRRLGHRIHRRNSIHGFRIL